MTEGTDASGFADQCKKSGVHVTSGDSPYCINCGIDTSEKPVRPDYGNGVLPKEKIVQITTAQNGLYALTSRGRLFLLTNGKWHEPPLPNFKDRK